MPTYRTPAERRIIDRALMRHGMQPDLVGAIDRNSDLGGPHLVIEVEVMEPSDRDREMWDVWPGDWIMRRVLEPLD